MTAASRSKSSSRTETRNFMLSMVTVYDAPDERRAWFSLRSPLILSVAMRVPATSEKSTATPRRPSNRTLCCPACSRKCEEIGSRRGNPSGVLLPARRVGVSLGRRGDDAGAAVSEISGLPGGGAAVGADDESMSAFADCPGSVSSRQYFGRPSATAIRLASTASKPPPATPIRRRRTQFAFTMESPLLSGEAYHPARHKARAFGRAGLRKFPSCVRRTLTRAPGRPTSPCWPCRAVRGHAGWWRSS